ncbi:MAG TPA: alanine dehydrogenase [Pseudonocardia sp.]|nr:alanine dehydrogenase [Pseudonocardia sp.]
MRIGVPREVKNHEYRVALTPPGAHELTRAGHEVLVEQGAGVGSSFPDADYKEAGATIVTGSDAGQAADEVWAGAELVVKVKEPVAEEYHRLRRDQVLFTYLHLAASRPCTEALLAAGTTAIAYETVRLADGSLPLLAPMSEVAGRLAPQAGAHALLRASGGRGILLGGVPGVRPAEVVVIGAGVSGQHAVQMAVGLGAAVTVLDVDLGKLRRLDERYGGRVRTVVSNAHQVERACLRADLVIGAVLVPGARAPQLVGNDLVRRMKPGSVLVDVAIDQGGCFEDSRPTTHAEPTYPVHGSIFYCVANMPGAVPHTSTLALTNATLPYLVRLAELGWRDAVAADPALAAGLTTRGGELTSRQVAESLGLPIARA